MRVEGDEYSLDLDTDQIEIGLYSDGTYYLQCLCKHDLSKSEGRLTTDQWRTIRDWINTYILKEDTQGGQV